MTRRGLLLAGVLALQCGLFAPAVAETLTGVSQIIDGDSLEVASRRVDLKGIDAPELEQTCYWPKKRIDCGVIAKSALMDLTAGAEVTCVVEETVAGAATLGVCRAAGYDLAEGMAHTGWALATADAPRRYKEAMQGARAAGRALWRGQFISPEEWRAGRREEGK